jgi:hypothetical protein
MVILKKIAEKKEKERRKQKSERVAALSVILMIVISIIPLYSKKLGALPELDKPDEMLVNNGQLIISDETVKVHLYALKELKYLKQVTRKGEGPGECFFRPRFWVGPDFICLHNPGKCMFFSRNGEYKRELRITGKDMGTAVPIGRNYLVERFGRKPGKSVYYKDLSIETYSKEKGFQCKKLIYHHEHPPRQRKGGKFSHTIPREYVDFIIVNDKVLVADSMWGLFAEIYDREGNRISQIKPHIEKIKVTEKFKTNVLETFKKNSQWAQFKQMYYLVFPEYFPAIFKFSVDKGKIYFMTYNQKQDKREIIITDWQGNLLKRTFVPWPEDEIQLNYSIENDKYYYLLENEDTGEWELHMEEIK